MIEILIPLILLGIFAGLLSGFFGIGSGIILVPAYIFLFNYLNFPPEIIPLLATGSSMGTMAITIPMASYTHYKNKNINLEVIKYMFLAAIIATIFGRYVAANIESSTLQIIIAISLLLAAIQLVFDFSPKNINKTINKIELFLIGGFIALITSFVGIGGGILMVPYFQFRGLKIHEAIGTSSLMGFFFAISGLIGALLFAPDKLNQIDYVYGSVFIPAILIAGISSIYFARLGANISNRIDGNSLKLAFSVLVILVALRIIYITFI